jgi:hypothetical protein
MRNVLRQLFFLVFAASLLLVASAQSPTDHEMFEYNRRLAKQTHSYVPKNGFVPDKDTATAVAYAVALPVFGKKMLDSEMPLQAELKDGVWTVQGTMHCTSCTGGTLVMQVEQATGKILFLIHTQ